MHAQTMHQKSLHLVLSKVDVCLLFRACASNPSKGRFHKMIMIIAEWFRTEKRRGRRGEVILGLVVVILIGGFFLWYTL
jgi:hypothetical protein